MRIYLKQHIIWILLLILLNLIIVSDYVIHDAKPANLDAGAHIITIAQFSKGLRDGEFPVMWGDGFANYGLPLGTIAHQIPSYLGALITFITANPLTSFHLLYLISAIASAIGLYYFLSKIASKNAAFLGTFLYSLGSYRILNIYVRGAMPEFFSSLWIPFLFVVLFKLYKRNLDKYYFLFTLLLSLLFLSHPMSPILYGPSIFVVCVFLFWKRIKIWSLLVVSSFGALLMAAYYYIPLNLESKYLYFGKYSSHYVYNQAVILDSLLNPIWRYACAEKNYIFWRCPLIKVGEIEIIILSFSLLVTVYVLGRRYLGKLRDKDSVEEESLGGLLSRRYEKRTFFYIGVVGAMVNLLLSSQLMEFAYERIYLLGNIQIPSRFLSAFAFFPPILIAILFDSVKKTWVRFMIWSGIIMLLVVLRFPQLYGKNYVQLPKNYFSFAQENYHGLSMNPIWSIDSMSYPIQRDKAEVVQGKGIIKERIIKNASRYYKVRADSEVVISDYTFYFPGWHVYVDSVDVPIEFQDPAYRGVITFKVPPGEHTVVVVYEDTKVRKIGKLISLTTIMAYFGLLVLFFVRRRRIKGALT